MSTITLNPTQHAVLAYAIHNTEGRVEWFPENIKGGARQKVLQGLFNRALITSDGGTNWFVAAEGYDAMGCDRPTVGIKAQDDHELDAAVAKAEAAWTQDAQAKSADNAQGCNVCMAGTDAPESPVDATQVQPTPNTAPVEQPGELIALKAIRTREHSKQATIIGMLQRAEGATIAQICEATGWQAHTVRGTFAGAFKKKLGMTITSDKPEGGVRTYRAAA